MERLLDLTSLTSFIVEGCVQDVASSSSSVLALTVLSCVLQYILNDTEVEVKTELWMKQNAEYLKEQRGEDGSSSPSSQPAPQTNS